MVAFAIESWIWYGLATSIIILRLIARVVHLGSPLKLQIDDYLMVVALAFYTTDLATINIVANANTNLIPPGYLDDHVLNSQEISEREYGSKMVLVVEQCQIMTTWLCKACLLIMYHRITVTSFTLQNKFVKILAGYVAFCFIFMEVFYFGVWCRPFHNYWAVPTPNMQCSAAIHHLITNAVFNLSSDVAMLCIALPMFIRSHLPLQRKISLVALFSIGIFVIICAILNKYYSFTQPFGSMWTYWYVRECSTAVIVANLPFTWSLVRKIFRVEETTNQTQSKDSLVTRRSRFGSIKLPSKFKCFGKRQSTEERVPTPLSIQGQRLSRPDAFEKDLEWGTGAFHNEMAFNIRCCERQGSDESSASSLQAMEKAFISPDRQSKMISHGNG